MKKLMVAATVAMLGIAANAASMNWSTCSSVQDPNGNYCSGEEYVTMYMFVIDSTAYGELTKGGDSGVSAAVWNTYGTQLDSADAKYVDDGMGQFTVTDSSKSYGEGDTAYAAIIMAYDEGEGITHYKGNAGAYLFESGAEGFRSEMDTFVNGNTEGTAIAWSAVPEPTSGLLLLLGVAGLALRRRRA